MSQYGKSPLVNRNRERSPYPTSSPRNFSPKFWSSPHSNWQSRHWSAPQSNWSPQHNNSYSSSDGYWGHQRQWSPNHWDSSNYHKSWGVTPKTPRYSTSYQQSPVHGSVYPERKTQVHFQKNHKDVSYYYSPSMVKNPWAELEAKAKESATST